MMQDDLRAQLIKQFPSDAVETTDMEGRVIYACPTCKRPITVNSEKCGGCGQTIAWEHIRKEEAAKGVKTAIMKFEVPGDFTKGDCRKCPLSYITKENSDNVYECPLKMRAHCRLELS